MMQWVGPRGGRDGEERGRSLGGKREESRGKREERGEKREERMNRGSGSTHGIEDKHDQDEKVE